MKNTARQAMRGLADYIAFHNPDVAEEFGHEIVRSARTAKVSGLGFGIALRFHSATGALEMRGGDLKGYIAGNAPGDGYEEVIILPE